MLSPELLAKIRKLQIRTAHLVTSALAGDYQSTFKGRGMEFEDARVYEPGDDVRHIDWNTTARTNVPHIKNYREERELVVNLLVDVSASGVFGSKQRTKNEVAAEVAAILAHTAMSKNDKVGALLFTDAIEEFIPPKKGRAHVWQVIRSILTHRPRSRGTKISEALDTLNRMVHGRSVVFLISDFLDQNFEKALRVCRQRHDLICVLITDPREEEIPAMGFLEIEDAESGERRLLDTFRSDVRQHVEQGAKGLRARLRDRLKMYGVDLIEISTAGSTIDPIVAFFRKRMRRIR